MASGRRFLAMPSWVSAPGKKSCWVCRACVSPSSRLPPYPPSPVIGKITFAPESQIVRRAIDSDNWPITWGDDDAQYTAYGDGEGFEPFVDRKLSLGFAKVVGTPSAFAGTNVRSDT